MKKGEFKHPKGVAYSCKGYIVVADSENHRVQMFNEDGRFLRAFGSQGNQEGKVITIKLSFLVMPHSLYVCINLIETFYLCIARAIISPLWCFILQRQRSDCCN